MGPAVPGVLGFFDQFQGIQCSRRGQTPPVLGEGQHPGDPAVDRGHFRAISFDHIDQLAVSELFGHKILWGGEQNPLPLCTSLKMTLHPPQKITVLAAQNPVLGSVIESLQIPGLGLPDSRALEILKLIEKAEDSRRRRSHDQMIASRKELVGKEPDVFSAYMARVG